MPPDNALKQQFQPELDLPRRIRLIRDYAEGRIAEHSPGPSKLGRVEYVE